MSKTVKLKFNTEINSIREKIFTYDCEMTIENLLNSFLRETNSIHNLNSKSIQFVYKSKIINSDGFLKKKAKEIFRFLDQTNLVQVYDSQNIIGGKNKILVLL